MISFFAHMALTGYSLSLYYLTSKHNYSINIFCTRNHSNILYLISTCAAEPPRITSHPEGKMDAVSGKLVVFSIHATGTKPLSYLWECETESGNTGWQSCDVEVANSSTLTIPSVQKSNEGSYHCTVSNCAGSETSQCAILTVGELKYH